MHCFSGEENIKNNFCKLQKNKGKEKPLIGINKSNLWGAKIPKSVMHITLQMLFPNVACLFIFGFVTGPHFVVQAGLELMILLPQLPKCWNNRCGPPCLACYPSFYTVPKEKCYSL
jgi:hypothetical protein